MAGCMKKAAILLILLWMLAIFSAYYSLKTFEIVCIELAKCPVG